MNERPIEFGIILLAAGASVRMGEPKLLLPWRGRPMLRHVAEAALGCGASAVVVVLGSTAAEAKSVLSGLPIGIAENARWSAGMGASLKLGLADLLMARPDLAAAVIMLADQPMVSPADIASLLAAHRQTGKPIVASAYAGTLGPPALFAASEFPRLAAIPDASGAKRLFAERAEQVAAVPMPAAAMDIDTPGDYQALIGEQPQP